MTEVTFFPCQLTEWKSASRRTFRRPPKRFLLGSHTSSNLSPKFNGLRSNAKIFTNFSNKNSPSEAHNINHFFHKNERQIPFLEKYGFTFSKLGGNKLKYITFKSPLEPEISELIDGVEVLFHNRRIFRKLNAIW